jgi:hypothetical protein
MAHHLSQTGHFEDIPKSRTIITMITAKITANRTSENSKVSLLNNHSMVTGSFVLYRWRVYFVGAPLTTVIGFSDNGTILEPLIQQERSYEMGIRIFATEAQ